ncbi:MAG: AMP-binding protein [Alphaproteobacteria bacterium]|nr:AMP-binding protein [Alphaproteobacteria bacterium]
MTMDTENLNLGYFNRAAASTYPDKTALIDLSRNPDHLLSHSELDRRMDSVATMVSNIGMARGDRLLLAMGNRFEFIEIFFGAMRAGIIPIPLNIKLGAETIDFIIRDSGCRGAIIEPNCHPQLVEVVERHNFQTLIAVEPVPPGWTDYEEALAASTPDSFIPSPVEPGQIAFLPYTSGSTGRPKGVLLTHEGMLWGIRAAQQHWPCKPTDRTLVAGPLFHKNAMRVSIKPKLYAGASAVILPRFEPRTMLQALADYECTDTGGVPAMYRMMLAEEELLRDLKFPRLECLEMGSAVVGAELLNAVEKAFSADVEEAYGLTEGGGPLRNPLDGRPVPRGSCGVPAPEVAVKMVGEDGEANDSHGEFWVKSPAVLAGYNNRPDLNKERLTDGWLHTGDIFRKDEDGFYFFMGRIDDQFSCGGENIYPKEVELLLVQHPDIIDAVMMPITHDVKGLAPAALVTVRSGSRSDENSIKAFTLEHGAAYAHPRRVFIVEALPIGGTGKVDRPAARKIIEDSISTDTS